MAMFYSFFFFFFFFFFFYINGWHMDNQGSRAMSIVGVVVQSLKSVCVAGNIYLGLTLSALVCFLFLLFGANIDCCETCKFRNPGAGTLHDEQNKIYCTV
ncbi:hypothetical protein XELAEV_18016904mg [Xenopus laevis]|uniref:Uncharacterized protein n=1 Tax=Xenopus laevis TaxID=8355 RepID=A0A974DBF7_XENLA|nr:hypothetical protein XELAEV_18016904mg [Xenopus laevis]